MEETKWLIELHLEDTAAYFTGEITEDLKPKFSKSIYKAKEYPNLEDAQFARFYWSLYGTHLEEHSVQ